MKTHILPLRTFKVFLFILISTGLFFASCKKKKDNKNYGSSLSYIVNGTAKSTNGDENIYATMGANNTLTITSKITSSSETVTIVIPAIKTPGEFPITESASAVYVNGTSPEMNNYVATSGTIKVTAFSSTGVSGTFNFYSLNSQGAFKNLTEGSFEAKIVQ